MLTEREKRLFLTMWCDYAESQGAVFPNGRPDEMGAPPKEETPAQPLPNPQTGDTV